MSLVNLTTAGRTQGHVGRTVDLTGDAISAALQLRSVNYCRTALINSEIDTVLDEKRLPVVARSSLQSIDEGW